VTKSPKHPRAFAPQHKGRGRQQRFVAHARLFSCSIASFCVDELAHAANCSALPPRGAGLLSEQDESANNWSCGSDASLTDPARSSKRATRSAGAVHGLCSALDDRRIGQHQLTVAPANFILLCAGR